jgi:GT2 family glycosyltransferase
MNNKKNFFLNILDARDTSIANLRKSLEEKEIELLKLEEKEIEIKVKETALKKMTQEAEEKEIELLKLEEKEVIIQNQGKLLEKYNSRFRLWKYLIIPTERLVNKLLFPFIKFQKIFAPRLGNLQQYAPRELNLPTHYSNTIQVHPLPKISIVTPSFKQGEFIERTIKSVLEQSYPNLEYFIQDGGSEDTTQEILEQYSDRLTGWECKNDNGQTHAINLGFAKTTGEIMAWLNSDDIILPGTLAYVADYFKNHPEVDVVYGNRLQIDINDKEIGRWIMPAHDNTVLSWADFIPQETLYWRRSIWEKVDNRVDESFRFAMDWDLLVRLRDAGARFARLPRFLGGFRIHPQQKTSSEMTDVGTQEMNRIRQRLLGKTPSEKEIFKAVKPYLIKHIIADLVWRVRNI